MTTLNTRIADALKKTVPSTEAAIVLDDVGSALAQAKDQLARDRQAALDPLADDKAVAASRKAIEETTFQIDRLTEAKDRLQDRFDELLKAEQRAAENARAKALKERQDRAKAQFNHEYPLMANRIAALCLELKDAGVEISATLRLPQVNLDLPGHHISTSGFFYYPINRMASAQPAADYQPDRSGRLRIDHEPEEATQ